MNTNTKTTVYDWIIEICSIIALLSSFRPLFFFNTLANKIIPNHYNILGEVDGWGGKGFLWLLPLLALAFYIGFSILGKKYSNKLNYPVKITKQNASNVYKLGSRMMQHLKFFIILIFAYINNVSFAIAKGKEYGLNMFVITILLCGLIITILFFCMKMMKTKKQNV